MEHRGAILERSPNCKIIQKGFNSPYSLETIIKFGNGWFYSKR